MNYKKLSEISQNLLKGLQNGTISHQDAKEQNNCIGKVNNLFKAKLDYNINRHRIEPIDFFEDELSN